MTIEERVRPKLLDAFEEAGFAITLRILIEWLKAKSFPRENHPDDQWIHTTQSLYDAYWNRYYKDIEANNRDA